MMWRHTYALCNFLLKQTRWTRHEQNATIRNSQTLAGHRLRILITQPESKVLQDHVPLQQHSIGQIQRKGPSKIPLKMSPYTQGAESLRARSLRTFPRQNGLPDFKFSRRTSTVFHMSPPWNRSTLWGFPLTILYLRRVCRAYRSWSFVYYADSPIWVCLKKGLQILRISWFPFRFPENPTMKKEIV